MQLGLSEILISCGNIAHCVTKSISNAKFVDKRISVQTLAGQHDLGQQTGSQTCARPGQTDLLLK